MGAMEMMEGSAYAAVLRAEFAVELREPFEKISTLTAPSHAGCVIVTLSPERLMESSEVAPCQLKMLQGRGPGETAQKGAAFQTFR